MAGGCRTISVPAHLLERLDTLHRSDTGVVVTDLQDPRWWFNRNRAFHNYRSGSGYHGVIVF
jgi:hypothetical protein